MTNGKMPSGDMVEPDRKDSLDDAAKQVIQLLMQLSPTQLATVRERVNSLSKTDSASGTASAAESGGSVAAAATGNPTLDNAMNAASRVQDLGFVEFTAGLINGTFDAIIGATVKQMEAYSKLVAELSKSIQQFQAENVSDAQITDYLAERFPDGKGGTSVVPETPFTDTPADAQTGAKAKTASEKIQDIVNALILETKGLPEAQRLTRAEGSLGIAENATVIQFSKEQVEKIRTAIGASLATNMIGQLRQMARDGMARIVITDGEILTKLTFNITATTQQQKRKENYNQNINETGISGGIGGGWWGVSASTKNTNININSVNETSFDSTTMNVEMIGQVKLRFKTETFPPINVPPADNPAPPAPKP
jgi:hypothetical protein